MIKNIWVYVTNVFHRNTPLPESFLKRVIEYLPPTASALGKEKTIKDL